MVANIQQATFGGGCFWCTEAIFKELKGVRSVRPGYSGGTKPNPTYAEVCGGATGHAEVIQIEFDETEISYDQLVEVFFLTHDPTQLNRQGNDVGAQYRSVIFYSDDKQKHLAETVRARIEAEHVYDKPIVTGVLPLKNFYPAEDYHRDYYAKNPDQAYCQAVISPKVAKFRQKFAALRKT